MNAECGARNAESSVATSLALIRQRIIAACTRVGRKEAEVTLVAVSKTVSAARVQEAIAAGLTIFGENRVQEAEAKITQLAEQRPSTEWHLIGHLQSNKARKAVTLFDVVQSVDSEDLALRLDRIAQEVGKRLPVFIEVNLGKETAKAGVAPTEALPLLEKVSQLAGIELRGLMSVPPFLESPEDVRPFFRQLRQLRDEAIQGGIVAPTFTQLSMGMSHDFDIAIEEGATLVRIGTALFGARG